MQTSAPAATDLAEFGRQGYLILPGLVTPTRLELFRAEAERLLELALDSTVALGRRHPRLRAQMSGGRLEVNMLRPVNDLSPLLGELCLDQRLLGPLHELMGDAPMLLSE